MLVDVLRASDRFLSSGPGLEIRSAFSVGPHWDPDRTGHGLLLVSDAITVEPGARFAPHAHRGVEVVTWVLSGALRHEDDAGRSAVVRAGQVKVLDAGSGLVHAESCVGDEPVRFLQSWIASPGHGGGVAVADLPPLRGLRPAVSGLPGHDAVLRLRAPAALLVARPAVGEELRLPAAPLLQLTVLRGAVALDGAGELGEGDAARLRRGGERVRALEGAELVVWLVQEIAAPTG